MTTPISRQDGDRDDDDDDDDRDDDDGDDRDNGDEPDDDEPDGDDEPDDDEPDDDDKEEAAEVEEPARRKPPRPPLRQSVIPTLIFIACAIFLNISVNLRYPGAEPGIWFFAPSLDIVIVFMCLAWAGQLSWRIPRFVRIGAVVWLFVIRFMRLGDGVQERYFGQVFNLHSDLPLIPEAIRFVYSTRPFWQFAIGTVLSLAALVGLGFLWYRALAFSERYLRDIRHVYMTAALVALGFFGTKLANFGPRHAHLFKSGFAASAMPRVFHEIELLANVYDEEAEFGKVITATGAMLDSLPSDLAKLEGANVHFILVESYGRAMFEVPALVNASKRTFESFEGELSKKGFEIASLVLDSSTYGGQSWLAHATIGTGVRTKTQLEYELVLARKPKTLATFFREAGYRTVVAQPGTTREWPKGEFYNFEQKYYSWHYGYKGPKFAWATMSDQFILDFVRRREFAPKSKPAFADRAARPLFIQYVLVSSHAPWSALPPVIDDWATIGNGSIYHKLPVRRFPIEWPHFENATEAYGASIVYDFEILRTFIANYIDDGSLIVILGDHQPVPEVNGHSREMGVPIHVLSKNPALIKPFLERGYVKGLLPNVSGYHQGLETFLPNLLVDFSIGKRAAAR
jgi:hypothetical protein